MHHRVEGIEIALEKLDTELHGRISGMRSRALQLVGIFGIPLITLVGAAAIWSDQAQDQAEAAEAVNVVQREEIRELETMGHGIREDLASIQTTQEFLREAVFLNESAQTEIFTQLRQINGR